MNVFLSVVFPDECNWEKVVKIVDKYKTAHSFEFSHALYYTGDYNTGEELVQELAKMHYPMHIMRNIE